MTDLTVEVALRSVSSEAAQFTYGSVEPGDPFPFVSLSIDRTTWREIGFPEHLAITGVAVPEAE